MIKKLSFSRLFAAFLIFFSLTLVPLAAADTTGTVTATVTAQNVSVSVSDGAVSFGTVTTSDTQDTTSGGVDDSQTATNDGNVTEDFSIKATDSTNWTLDTSAGDETYTMKSCTSDCDGSPTWNAVGIDPSYQTLSTSVAASGSTTFDLQVGTPTSTTSYTEQTITVTILAAAS